MRADNGEHSILVLLDLTATFDTTDHSIMVERLNKWVGISGSTLNLTSHPIYQTGSVRLL